MIALTNEIKQMKIRETTCKRKTGEKPVRCYGCNNDGHIKHNCPKVKKHFVKTNLTMLRTVKSNAQQVCRTNRSIDVGSLLEEASLYIQVIVHGMHIKVLIDTGEPL